MGQRYEMLPDTKTEKRLVINVKYAHCKCSTQNVI